MLDVHSYFLTEMFFFRLYKTLQITSRYNTKLSSSTVELSRVKLTGSCLLKLGWRSMLGPVWLGFAPNNSFCPPFGLSGCAQVNWLQYYRSFSEYMHLVLVISLFTFVFRLSKKTEFLYFFLFS